jgi:hypothetical protein
MFNKPIGVQRQRTKGSKLPPNTACVTRGTTWGNPYKVGPNRTAEMACLLFERDLLYGVLKDKKGTPLIERIGELRGRNLACFCSIGVTCHRDILLNLANK